MLNEFWQYAMSLERWGSAVVSPACSETLPVPRVLGGAFAGSLGSGSVTAGAMGRVVAATDGEVQSVVRALGLLEAVAAAGEMGVTELARAQGLHVATAHNLLRTLAGRHYLLNRHGRYRLGPAVAMLGAGWEPLHALPDLVQPSLVQIADGCGEAASATILVGREARLIGFQPGTEAITIHYPQWLWPEALKLATGRCWWRWVTRRCGRSLSSIRRGRGRVWGSRVGRPNCSGCGRWATVR